MTREKDKLLDHEYDGIGELDNDMPRWWVWLFIITIIFSFFYLMHFHVFGFGDSSHVKYMKEIYPDYEPLAGENPAMLANVFPSYKSPFYVPGADVMQQDLMGGGAKMAAGFMLAEEEAMDMDVQQMLAEADIAAGQKLYAQYCFTCHGSIGEGGIGPNLTDEYWIHGGSFPEVIHTIKKGVPVKGMIAWETQLKPDQILQVGSYAYTLIGTNPPNAKEPQGDLIASE